MKKSIVLLIACIALSSCISIETEITMKNDGSGIMQLLYRVSSEVRELGRIGNEIRPLPLPIYKEDIENLLATHDGITLKNHSIKEEDGNSIVNITLAFNNVKALSPLFGDEEDIFSFQTSGAVRIFKQSLPLGGNGDIDENTMKMVESYCSDNYFLYSIHTPSPITDYTIGDISENKKHLTYKIGIPDAVNLQEKQIIEIKW